MNEKTDKKKKKAKGAPKPDSRPARARYWQAQRLMLRKLRALVRSGATIEQALAAWGGRSRVRRNAQEYLPTQAAKRLQRLVDKVKVRRAANLVRAMERWEAREKARAEK